MDVPEIDVPPRRQKRPLLILAAVSASVFVVSLVGAMLIVGTSSQSSRVAVAADAQDPRLADEDKPTDVPWYERQQQQCQVDALDRAARGEATTGLVFDGAIREPIEVNLLDECENAAAHSPDPIGDIGGGYSYENGQMVFTYYELHREATSASFGAPISPEVAEQRIAAQRIIAELNRKK